jgi:hypothetical protein
MNAHPMGVRTKRKASTVSRKGPLSFSNSEVTRNSTRGQGLLRRALKPVTHCFHDVAAVAALTAWLFLGGAIHLGWVP